MKGYQISQYDMPLSRNGRLDIEVEGESRHIGITRVHLEEDVAKLIHRDEAARPTASSTSTAPACPLMEIVSEPDMRSPEEARQYLMKLRQHSSLPGRHQANMEEGSFRCDANISLRPDGTTELGPR